MFLLPDTRMPPCNSRIGEAYLDEFVMRVIFKMTRDFGEGNAINELLGLESIGLLLYVIDCFLCSPRVPALLSVQTGNRALQSAIAEITKWNPLSQETTQTRIVNYYALNLQYCLDELLNFTICNAMKLMLQINSGNFEAGIKSYRLHLTELHFQLVKQNANVRVTKLSHYSGYASNRNKLYLDTRFICNRLEYFTPTVRELGVLLLSSELPRLPKLVIRNSPVARKILNLTPAALASLSTDTDCPACLEDLTDKVTVSVPPNCNHVYCQHCMQEWIKNQLDW